ncbi:unnamed protein product [Didymodactylos carnosus]|uniref:Reverse transcriptase RNase H-like domain-containing protein n=1 Tax=Didymodactylos carnosus TaxID=1234261 RepID=A0A815EKU6_9BILA|nr:unnamed protein product [Didymodactylos carnosus]CAF1316159.1 unnamed protein product [Didymodactylos carnosus]CAF3845224.1 unnamed protein product [Didymodactylos carnosus]CAF4158172.1 unnamed protein product [Didymodactylos carnosus]
MFSNCLGHSTLSSIFGRKTFEVWTDHKSLVWLRNLKDPTSRLARWGMKLDAYDMVIKHRSGAANQNVDTLSRYPVQSEVVASLQTKTLNDALQLSNNAKDRLTGINVWDSCNVLDNIKEAQRNDKNLRLLIDYLHDGILSSNENISKKLRGIAKYYKVIDGRLYRLRRFDEEQSNRFNYS